MLMTLSCHLDRRQAVSMKAELALRPGRGRIPSCGVVSACLAFLHAQRAHADLYMILVTVSHRRT